jgi:16S rRNA (guanine527-N7)-methyltransferase
MDTERVKALEQRFNDLVMEWNSKINLVSRKKTNIYDLIEDSRRFLDYIDFKEGLEVLDLGTGGGLPGVVIKLHHPEINITLVDSIKKKSNALGDIIFKLGLKGTDVVNARAEDIAKHPNFKGRFDYIVARSVSTLDYLVRWSKNLVKPGGKLITIKGIDISEEVLRAKHYKYVKNIEFFENNGKNILVVNFTSQ